jgi:hypothetical protein
VFSLRKLDSRTEHEHNENITTSSFPEQGMSSVGRSTVLSEETELAANDAIVQAYIEAARGDAHVALTLAVADSLEALAELQRRVHATERLVSRGFCRGVLPCAGRERG